ncbi:MAG: carbon-nitrogen hydrolase family protein [Chloroflexales bacterium]|nr:carbon-nitrogen hydrolase family protein [Chloroflexales bacterium]
MKVTVCEMRDDRAGFAEDWASLVVHVRTNASDLVLLNELPFAPWFGTAPHFDAAVWQTVVAEHESWIKRLSELAPATVITTRPVDHGARRLNEGFLWTADSGYQAIHAKYYLPDEEGVWEASWYHRGDDNFQMAQTSWGNIGFLICSELWALGRAQAYGKAGAHLLVTPRATGRSTVDKWLVGGRAAAMVAGAFALSSNRVHDSDFGGQGWVIDPDGAILGVTSREQPFVTVEIDLRHAEAAKQTYPRYVLD